MYRHRFQNDILAEFLPPARKIKKTKLIILCDGMPSIPRKQPLAHFLASKGYWVIYPRYRGSWESGGTFLDICPEKDIDEIIDALPKGLTDIAFGEKFKLKPDEIYVIGGSFGGCTALICSLNPKIKKVIANCPVVDWAILDDEQGKETSNKNYAAYIREAFGSAYRLPDKNWKKLQSEKFFNPAKHIDEIDSNKVMMFHAKDDPYIPWKVVYNFADKTGVKLNLLSKGSHLSTVDTVEKYWDKIKKFFESK